MLIDADIIRMLLICFLLGMMALGLIYLSRRSLSFWGYLFYGLIVILLPIFGPFWVIAVRPGKHRLGVSLQPPNWFLWLSQKLSNDNKLKPKLLKNGSLKKKLSVDDKLNQKLSR